MNSSGLLFTYSPDGSARIGYEDYNVEIFDGSDYEVTYYLDKVNFETLLKALNISSNDNIKNKLVEKFGEFFEKENFIDFCKENDINYDLHTYIS